MRSHATAARDEGLRKVSQVTRWVAAGGLALTGFFTGVAAHAFSGHSTRSTTTVDNTGNGGAAPDGNGQVTDPAATDPSTTDQTPSTAAQAPTYRAPTYQAPTYRAPTYQPTYRQPAQVPQSTSRSAQATSGGS